ncbi:MAG: helix-turn-helix domain-containing protein [Patescibacteria group bacterium]|nr:helix-turn-helix domain-containing protein [Patescibacteria group bacterium]
MEVVVHASQIKAARAILDWSRKDLARLTGLGHTTIRRLESGDVSPRDATNSIIQQVIENAGLELIDGEGVRRRSDVIKMYKGRDGLDQFLEDIAHTVRKKKSGDIAIMIKSMDGLVQALRVSPADCLKQFDMLGSIANVKCLLAEVPKLASLAPASFEFRITHKENIGPASYFIYGDRYANALMEFGKPSEYVVFSIPATAQSHHDHFSLLWENALPLSAKR